MITNPILDPNQQLEQVTNPQAYANSIVQLLFSIFMFVGIIYFAYHFIFAAYHFIGSQGDSKKIEEAKHEITYCFVGLFVVFAVFAVLRVIGLVFNIPGLDTLRLTFPTL